MAHVSKKDPCPSCGSREEMSKGVERIVVKVGGQTFDKRVPCLRCGKCEVAFVNRKERDDFDRKIAEGLLGSESLPTDALALVLDAFHIDPSRVGLTWRQVKDMWRPGALVPPPIWQKVKQAAEEEDACLAM